MCKLANKQVALYGQDVGNALIQIANAAQAYDPTLAADLEAGAAALIAATSNFTTGSATADIETAATAIQAILDIIPVTAPYAVFVAIAANCLVLLLANLGAQDTMTGDQIHDALLVRSTIAAQPEHKWDGVYKIRRHFYESYPQALKGAWNGEVEKNPTLGFVKL